MKHRGEIVQKAVKLSGLAITDVAKKTGYSRTHLYVLFGDPELSFDKIINIGKAINYDFRKDFPELFIQEPRNIVNEPLEMYGTGQLAECLKEKNEWKNKYLAAIEENNQLLRELNSRRQ